MDLASLKTLRRLVGSRVYACIEGLGLNVRFQERNCTKLLDEKLVIAKECYRIVIRFDSITSRAKLTPVHPGEQPSDPNQYGRRAV